MLSFHPDRLVKGIPFLQALGRDRLYRSQFETGASNGGLTAYHGGDRWSWESRMFGGAYDHAPAAERPKYGSLNFPAPNDRGLTPVRLFACAPAPGNAGPHIVLLPR
jgi:Protein of unknown function (DUF3626)